jgi:large subunit ribosomal protein L29
MKKITELRELSVDELQLKVSENTEELFNLRFQQATNRLENPMVIRKVRREIARLNSLITEKQTKEV